MHWLRKAYCFFKKTDYLSKRTQDTYCNETASDENEVLCGVPQDSTLGPLLFSSNVNDLPRHSNFSVRMFADELVTVTEWARFNRLLLKRRT